VSCGISVSVTKLLKVGFWGGVWVRGVTAETMKGTMKKDDLHLRTPSSPFLLVPSLRNIWRHS
jgi:hypothetical protein